jgi:NADH:ubiquinone oxidoreductase subunit D
MTELDEYNESNDDEDEAPQKAMTVDEYNKYDEIKLKYEELEAENRNVYKRLLKSNEQITNLVKIVMQNINMETIKSDLEEHKKIVTENKDKKNNKSIKEFVESIELF